MSVFIPSSWLDAWTLFLVSRLLVSRLGRSKTLLTSLTLTVVSGVLVCVSPYPTIFIITRFFLAAASSGVYLTLYIIREYSHTHTHTQAERPVKRDT